MKHVMSFTVLGKPEHLRRARTSQAGFLYDPKENRDAKKHIACICQRYMAEARQCIMPKETALRIYISATFARAKTNKRVLHVARPDVDNISKLVLDALNGVLYHDDSSIVSLHASKHYGDPPRVEIDVFAVENEREIQR